MSIDSLSIQQNKKSVNKLIKVLDLFYIRVIIKIDRKLKKGSESLKFKSFKKLKKVGIKSEFETYN